MAEGKVTIQIDMDGRKAQSEVKSLKSTLLSLGDGANKIGGSFKSLLAANVVGSALMSGIGALKGGLTSMYGELSSNTKAWKTFEGNLTQVWGASEETSKKISQVKSTLQDYATQTIYSASDMAQTYSQLAAVGIKNTDQLVMGFGGLAAAAENPTQAMKTLSQQATQMAAKPKVQWQDFKLMLEQTPAGIAAVAKEMGMSTSEMVTAVQDGKIATEDFFNAVAKVGNSDQFKKMATEFKTIDQAIDGAKETLSNKLMPAFEKLNQFGIKTVVALTDALDKINFDKLADNLGKALDSIDIEGMFSKAEQAMKMFFNPLFVINFKGALDMVGQALHSITSAFTGVAGGGNEWISTLSNAVSALLGTIAAGAKIVKKFMDSFADTGAMQAIKNAISSVITAFTVLTYAVGNSSIWSTLGTVIGNVAKVIAQVVKAIADFVSSLPPNQIRAIATSVLAAVAAFKLLKVAMAIGGAVKGVVTAISMVKSFAGAVALVKYGWGLLTAALASNPFGWIAMAIAAVVGALVYLWNTNEGFRNACISAWNAIKNAISTAWNFIKGVWSGAPEFFSHLWETITTFFKNAWNGITEWFSNLWNGIKQAPSNAVESIKNMWSSVKDFFSNLWNGITQIFSTVWQTIQAAVLPIIQPFIDIMLSYWQNLSTSFSQIWDGIKQVFQGAWEIIKAIVMGPVLLICDLITGNFGKVGSDLQLIWQSITTGVSTVWNGVLGILSGIWNAILATGQAIWQTLSTAVVNIVNGLVSGVVGLWNGLQSAVVSIASAIANGAISAWNSLTSGVSSLVSGFVGTITGLWNGLSSGVIGIARGLVSGAVGAFNGLVGGVSSIVSSVSGVLNSLGNINLAGAGAAIMNGFLGGLKSAWGAVQSFVGGIADWIRAHKGPISYDRRLLIPAGKAIMKGLNTGLISSFEEVKDTVSTITGTFASFMPSKPMKAGFELDVESALKDIKFLNQKVEDLIGAGSTNFSHSIQVKSDLDKAIKAKVEIVQEKSNEVMEKTIDAMGRLADRPIDMRLNDDTLIASTSDRYQDYQQTQITRNNRMWGRP
ncbi:MAG: tape measure protein [Streptococcus infantarius]